MQGVVSLQAWTALVAKQALSITIRGILIGSWEKFIPANPPLQGPIALDLLWVVPPLELEAAMEVALTQIEHKT